MKKDNVKNTMQIHSQAKVEFYEKYLKRYLRILNYSPNISQINIYDVFCGTGIYDDGKKGSPIVSFEAIKDLYYENQSNGKATKKVVLSVNDGEKGKVENVKNYIDPLNKSYCEINYHNLDAEQMFDWMITGITQSHQSVRNLVFIDPYGYKKNKERNIRHVDA